MAQILFTPLATEDLQQIWIYIAENAGKEVANKFLLEIKKKCESIAEFPESGRVRHELVINLRSLPLKTTLFFICRWQMVSKFYELFTAQGILNRFSMK